MFIYNTSDSPKYNNRGIPVTMRWFSREEPQQRRRKMFFVVALLLKVILQLRFPRNVSMRWLEKIQKFNNHEGSNVWYSRVHNRAIVNSCFHLHAASDYSMI